MPQRVVPAGQQNVPPVPWVQAPEPQSTLHAPHVSEEFGLAHTPLQLM